MLSLSYASCYDPYNTVFRMSAVLRASENHSLLTRTLGISDFFLCFPSRLTEIRPPNAVKGMRGRRNKVLRIEVAPRHEILPSSRVLFERMSVVQNTAISAMAAKSIVELEGAGDKQSVRLLSENLSAGMNEKIQDFTSQHAELLELVAVDFAKMDLKGIQGLRARTGLGEWEYDAI